MAAPFFVVGAPRSGTTLLQQLLTRHPDIAVTPETHFLQRFVHSATAGRDLSDDAEWQALLTKVEATEEFVESELDVEDFRARCAAGPHTVPAVFDAWLRAFAHAHGVGRVGEKTPNHLFDVDLLRSWFPGARFVVVIRDPRPVALSTGKVWWTAGSARADARAWRRYETALRKAQAAPWSDRELLLVRYEELVAAPQQNLDRIFALLGVDPVDVGVDRDRAATAVNVDREFWKARSTGRVDASTVDAWRQIMPAADVRAVEFVTWHGMRRRGYLPTHTGPRLLPGIAVEDLFSTARRTQLRLRRFRDAGSRTSRGRSADDDGV